MGQGQESELRALRPGLFLSRKDKWKSLEKSKFLKLEAILTFLFYKKLWSAIGNHFPVLYLSNTVLIMTSSLS